MCVCICVYTRTRIVGAFVFDFLASARFSSEPPSRFVWPSLASSHPPILPSSRPLSLSARQSKDVLVSLVDKRGLEPADFGL